MKSGLPLNTRLAGNPVPIKRQTAILAKVQKALGEYLERQRAAFPRFYFLATNYLLDILSNGSTPTKVMKHIDKVLLATAKLTLEEVAAIERWALPRAEDMRGAGEI